MEEAEIIKDLKDRIVKFVEEDRYSKALNLITKLKEIGETMPDFDMEAWETYEKQVRDLQNKEM